MHSQKRPWNKHVCLINVSIFYIKIYRKNGTYFHNIERHLWCDVNRFLKTFHSLSSVSILEVTQTLRFVISSSPSKTLQTNLLAALRGQGGAAL